MYSRQYKARKTSAKSSDTPVSNQFAPRPFVVQPQPQTPDLQTQQEKAEQSSNSFANISTFRPGYQPPSPPRIQMKLTIGQPGDKYEQEADRVAAGVVQRINSPQISQIQRLDAPEEEDKLQMKPFAGTIQRQEQSEEDKLQMKPIVQRLSVAGGMAATPDLEKSIQGMKGNGQPLAENIRQPMEQVFGTDFSRVKIHSDSKSDHLNQSIQAKAFTTGQDIFFRQGEYAPGTRGGQELIAHELTHVVQQRGGVVQRSHPRIDRQLPNTYTTSDNLIQRLDQEDVTSKTDKTLLKKIRDNYNNSLGLGKALYKYKGICFEDFDYYFEQATSLGGLEKTIDNAIKKAEAKKQADETKPTEVTTPEPTSPAISQPPSTTPTGSGQGNKTKKKKPPKQDITAQVFTGSPATKQEPVYVTKDATNPLIKEWIKQQPAGATIIKGEIIVKEDTVYIHATVRIRDTTVTDYPEYNQYNIETHYHPVPISKNFLHVKRSAGSDAGNVVKSTSWLIPGGAKTLNEAVAAWDSDHPTQKSKHTW
ncbi:DUF4157 domain-containing protein [Anabaena sp. CCY 9402-a]|uniref:eCIS core domain-containing protein n=1 Tax=Anabaena sp. CCY 9402-a TaxID=3103867 RepID=UPI0039C5AFBD